MQGIQFDADHVIEREIIESTHGHSIEALIHPFLITQLCRNTEVPMHDSEEKVIHRLPMPLSRSKEGVPDDMDEDEEEATVGEVGDSTKDEDDDDTNNETSDLPIAL